MSSLSFVDEMADIQRSVAQCHDQVVRRSTVLDIMQLGSGQRVLEVGCGGGFYAVEAAKCVGSTGRVCAIDYSSDQIDTAGRQCEDMEWTEFRVGDAASLPYEDNAFDVVYGVQVYEYIEQPDAALLEIRRVLRPGGRCFILSTDWRTAVWHSRQPERMQRILSVWETHSHTVNLPSVIGVKLQNARLTPLRQTPMTFLNRSYHRNAFSYWAARVIRTFLKNNPAVLAETADAWFSEFDLLENEQAYFFCLTSVLTEAIKIKP